MPPDWKAAIKSGLCRGVPRQEPQPIERAGVRLMVARLALAPDARCRLPLER